MTDKPTPASKSRREIPVSAIIPPEPPEELVLKPCPFCGFERPEIMSNGIGDYFVICYDSDTADDEENGCGARSGQERCESHALAAERWNLRTPELTAGQVQDIARAAGIRLEQSDGLAMRSSRSGLTDARNASGVDDAVRMATGDHYVVAGTDDKPRVYPIPTRASLTWPSASTPVWGAQLSPLEQAMGPRYVEVQACCWCGQKHGGLTAYPEIMDRWLDKTRPEWVAICPFTHRVLYVRDTRGNEITAGPPLVSRPPGYAVMGDVSQI